MKALITGANGFVGRHLVNHLHAMDDDVVTSDRATGGPDVTDLDGFCDLFASHSPDAVYHLAGQADVGASWETPLATFETNATGTLTVLLAAATAGVARVLVVTSADIYGQVSPEELPIREDQPLRPGNPYAASKAAAEMLAIQANTASLCVIRARAFNHLGPGQSLRFVAPALARRILDADASGQPRIAVGNLDARRDFTDVRDVVRAYRMLMETGEPGEAYNICSGTDRSIAEVVDLLVELTGTMVELVPDPELQRPSDTPVLLGDPSKINRAVGWRAEVPLRQTLTDLLAALRAQSSVGH